MDGRKGIATNFVSPLASWTVLGFHLKNFSLLFLIWGVALHPVAEGRYRCTLKDFIRLGNSCYFLSAEIASWQEAHFRCRDRGAQLAVLASQYEDSTLRSYLERPEFAQLGRWIGGMWASKWIWAAQGVEIENEDSFATSESFNLKEMDQWMCLYMDPNNRYQWNNLNCMNQQHYICEAALARVPNNATIINDDSPTVTAPSSSTSEESNAQAYHGDEDGNKTENDAGMDIIRSTVEEINLSTTPYPEQNQSSLSHQYLY